MLLSRMAFPPLESVLSFWMSVCSPYEEVLPILDLELVFCFFGVVPEVAQEQRPDAIGHQHSACGLWVSPPLPGCAEDAPDVTWPRQFWT